MQILWLSDNPLSRKTDYRDTVSRILPQVMKLDNICEYRVAPGLHVWHAQYVLRGSIYLVLKGSMYTITSKESK